MVNIETIAEQLEATAPSVMLRSEFWIVPVLQTIHILALSLLLTGFALIFLRAWGIAGKAWSWPQWSGRLASFIVVGFAGLVATGTFQVLAEPSRELPNWLFQAKIALILVSLPFAFLLLKLFARAAPGEAMVRLLSVILGVAVVVLIIIGRWIAYI